MLYCTRKRVVMDEQPNPLQLTRVALSPSWKVSPISPLPSEQSGPQSLHLVVAVPKQPHDPPRYLFCPNLSAKFPEQRSWGVKFGEVSGTTWE
jgi:hypothetical protein